MTVLSEILKIIAGDFKEAFTLFTAIVFMVTGIFMFLVEARSMEQKNLKAERLLLRILGVIYTIGSLLTYIIFISR
ncbi:hypothetical protein SAMN05660826_00345 [Caldanaerovirga acetigignens]|uniref:Uncharacterized protein n=1 Tax=Caldanaerovirga acetigignens TaxID=447595 RepID=A0A1M7GIH5_9FIRM|nr:CLC_0170 family protein [Caldanaerovirga acetigignens]SHM16011.1 hypothetical protein SAMN05660826_00345 [Caldanaerovirga acetigignens]